MEKFLTKYMYQNKWTDQSEEIFYSDRKDSDLPYAVDVVDGLILPQKSGMLPWGIGGCLDQEGNLVPESTVIRAYGGKYDYDAADVELLDETVVLLPIIPKHWGHFLIDAVSRMWIFLDERFDTSELKICYCSWGFEHGEIGGNYGKFLEYLGIRERMYYVDHPIRAKHVLVPAYTMSYQDSYNEAYKSVFVEVVKNIMAKEVIKDIKSYNRIYFTRTKLETSRIKETGVMKLKVSWGRMGLLFFLLKS